MPKRTPTGAAATEVILSVFKANGLLVASGDQLSASEDLSSARWQVLGAIALADRPLTVPQIARRMGLTRQSVHATVKRLIADRLVELLPNADHRRSRLVRPTDLGERRYAAIDRRQVDWVNRLAHGLGRSDVEAAARVLEELCARLEPEDETEVAGGGRENAPRGSREGGPMRLREMDQRVTYMEQLRAGNGPITLINVFNVAPEDAERLVEVWGEDAAFMKRQPGFVSTQLHRGTAGSSTFVNVAEWESAGALGRAFSSPEFQQRLEEYPDSVVASPHVFEKVAIPGI